MSSPDWNAVRAVTAHRASPPPSSPWVMTMSWCDLCFLHWQVDVDALRALVPAALPLDLFEGRAWLGVVPFRMEHTSARFLPDVPGFSTFPELNVRTYVVRDGQPGVYFFSLDATQPLAIFGARTFFHLNYLRADMSVDVVGGPLGAVAYRCVRRDPRGPPGRFVARYGPLARDGAAAPRTTTPGSLEHFLTERYCLYTVDKHGAPLRAHIHHGPWPLQDGFCDVDEDTIVPVPLKREGPPLVHFARRLDVVGWAIARA